jgi:predicted amidohydrolase
VEDNLREYTKVIDEAGSKNVDILVFPEATLNYYGLNGRQEILDQAVAVPNEHEKFSPCDDPSQYSKV